MIATHLLAPGWVPPARAWAVVPRQVWDAWCACCKWEATAPTRHEAQILARQHRCPPGTAGAMPPILPDCPTCGAAGRACRDVPGALGGAVGGGVTRWHAARVAVALGHHITRHSAGNAWVECGCGWTGPFRDAHDEQREQLLADDADSHLDEVIA